MTNRIVFLDYLRVLACLMVIVVHSCEPFYLGGDGLEILNRSNALWATLVDSAVRASVPLFVITSSYLLLPLTKSPRQFFARRFQRVVVPAMVWIVILSLVFIGMGHTPGEAFGPFVFSFNQNWGHLWFIYMIIGLYLIMPVISPWIEKVSKREEQVYLGIWLFTTLIPFFRQAALAMNGSTELWGEANWNEFGMLYYVSGFIGFVLLGHYFKKCVPAMSWRRTLAIAIPLWVVGYAIVAGWFWAVMPKDFPVSAGLEKVVLMEQSWRFCGTGVVLTTIAYFMIARKFTYSGRFYRTVVTELSKASYGTYLMHLVFIILYSGLFKPIVPTGLCILLTAVCTFATASILSIAFSRIPVVGQYLSGYKG